MYHDLSMFETSSNKSILLGYSACSSSGLTIGLGVRVKQTYPFDMRMLPRVNTVISLFVAV